MPLEYERFAMLNHNIFPTGWKSLRLLSRGMDFFFPLAVSSLVLFKPRRATDDHPPYFIIM